MRQSPLAILVLVLSLVMPVALATPSHAVTVNITIGTNLNSGRAITCSQGERILRNRGFRDVRRVDCRGRFFVYRAWRGGSRFEIAVAAHNGRVVDMRRIRR